MQRWFCSERGCAQRPSIRSQENGGQKVGIPPDSDASLEKRRICMPSLDAKIAEPPQTDRQASQRAIDGSNEPVLAGNLGIDAKAPRNSPYNDNNRLKHICVGSSQKIVSCHDRFVQ